MMPPLTERGSSVADILDRAADLIEPEGAWSNDDVARGPDGNLTHASDPEAVCWCALGAIWRESKAVSAASWPVERAVLQVIGGGPIARWNDAPERTQAQVVAKLREAAALAREQGK